MCALEPGRSRRNGLPNPSRGSLSATLGRSVGTRPLPQVSTSPDNMRILQTTGSRAAITVVLLLVTRLSVAAQDVGDRAHSRFRPSDELDARTAPDTIPTWALLLWGGIDANKVPFLEPAFVIDAPPALPRSAGEYRLTARTGSGAELFSLAFEMPEVADGDGSSSFTFVLPVQPGWEGSLASITLTGPGGSATLDESTHRPMAILRDPQTGRIQGILRDLPPTVVTQADAEAAVARAPELEVLFSRGIPGAVA